MEGGSANDMTKGTEGVGKLVKALLSARWVEKALSDWGNELVCLIPSNSSGLNG